MTEILIGTNPSNPQVVGSVDLTALAETQATQLPKARGYKILCALPTVDKTYASGIHKAEETMGFEERLATVLFVVELGPDCYLDTQRYPTGPWCKKGDFIIVRPNAGTRLIIHGKEFRVINEDSVEMTVQDPRGISRSV